MSLSPVDDDLARRLLERIVRQDEAALTELHRLMARRIYAFAFHRLDNHEMAESVVVDTLWEVWKIAGRFRGESKVSTWILGIARFKSLEARRDQMPEYEDIAEMEDILPDDGEDGAAAVERWQLRDRLMGCIRKLGSAHRECMQLVHFEGLGLAEVAKVQGVPENTVKTRMFHARRLLKACLELALA